MPEYTRPYVLGESSVPHTVGYLRGESGELVYVHYRGVYPDGRRIPNYMNSQRVPQHFVVVPGIVMQHTGLQERVLVCSPVKLADRAGAMSAMIAGLKLLSRDVGFVFW